MADWIEPGKKAPAFRVRDHEGRQVTLASLQGSPAVLYFYPRDNTPGCTKQACSFRDCYAELQRRGVQIFGVSTDSAESHAKFRDKFDLPFPLLVDSDHALAEKYGAWREKNMYGKKSMGIQRSTFLIDPSGKVARVWKRVKVDGHDRQVLEAVDELLADLADA